MDSCTPDLYGNDRVESSDSSLKRLETGVFVRKNAKFRSRACVLVMLIMETKAW
jgi:hypothetical protein